jgi:hypothetical protein
VSARGPVDAARGLLTAAEALSGQPRLVALALARACGPDAEPAWRERAGDGGFGAHARVWLAEQADREPAEADTAWVTADLLAILVEEAPPGLSAAQLADLVDLHLGEDPAVVAPALAVSGHPAAERLTALLTGHAPLPLVRDGGALRYQVEVRLLDVRKPPVWRRLEVRSDLTLDALHDAIQAAMGWEDAHLHVFSDGRADYSHPDFDLDRRDERRVRLTDLLGTVGQKLRYTYDLGDNWEHEITLEKVRPADPTATDVLCTAGKGACPPEDCGGPWGYDSLKSTLADPASPNHPDLLEWMGLSNPTDFDPHAFSVEEVNRRLTDTR